MEVQRVSSDMIKPSSPTPQNLRHYKLSFLDQMSPRAYCPFIYFYSSTLKSSNSENEFNNHIAEISNKLKESLSQTLTLYYPLAGRLAGDVLVQCNDKGALFTEARAKAKLSRVLENPVMLELNKLLPCELDEKPEFQLAVQLTAFECGGVAVGILVHHLIADALSSLVFVQTWTEIARGQSRSESASPEFISGEIFPAKDLGGRVLGNIVPDKGMCATTTTKKFTFHGSKINEIRAKLSHGGRERVSRVGVLSAFMWTCYARAAGIDKPGNPAKEYAVVNAVNIRPKCNPALPSHSFGNYYFLSATTGLTAKISEEEHQGDLAVKIGQDIRKIDLGFVEFIRENGVMLFDSIEKEQARVMKGEAIPFFCSSLCRFPLYEADFGFGEPAWVSSAARGFEKSVTFFDSKDGDGIEAFICLYPQDMAKLEADQEFLSFVSPTFS